MDTNIDAIILELFNQLTEAQKDEILEVIRRMNN